METNYPRYIINKVDMRTSCIKFPFIFEFTETGLLKSDYYIANGLESDAETGIQSTQTLTNEVALKDQVSGNVSLVETKYFVTMCLFV